MRLRYLSLPLLQNLLSGVLLACAFVFLALILVQRGVLTMQLEPSEMIAEQGKCRIYRLPYSVYTDNDGDPNSDLLLYEDEREIGPPHSIHQSIRDSGGGQYSHWKNTLYFSSTDGSDPITNAKIYVVKFSKGWPHVRLGFIAAVFCAVLVQVDRIFLLLKWVFQWFSCAPRRRFWIWTAGNVCAFLILAFALLRFSSDSRQQVRKMLPSCISKEMGTAYSYQTCCDVPLGDSLSDLHKSNLQLFEDGVALGPKHAMHDDIRSYGLGRYSHWHNMLLFSSSDNTPPISNGRVYTYVFVRERGGSYLLFSFGLFACVCVNCKLLVSLLGKLPFFSYAFRYIREANYRLVLFRCLAVGIPTIMCLAVLEVVFRILIPFTEPKWNCRFDPKLGYHFIPKATIKWTNHADFYCIQKSNSLGFLDREHSFENKDNAFRILILGDSFVEAAQLNMDQKFFAVLEKLLNEKFPKRKFECIALGYSGCGTSNELSFYEEIGRKFSPDLVVSLFISNDFANNSALLESIRNGWSPDSCPRLYFRKTDGGIVRQEIDPAWQAKQLKSTASYRNGSQKSTPLRSYLDKSLGWSRLYFWITRRIDLISQKKVKQEYNIYESRYRELKALEKYSRKLSGWDIQKNPNIDAMFFAVDLPPAFEDAVEVTEHCYRVLCDDVEKNGGKLLIVAGDRCSSKTPVADREVLVGGCLSRLQEIAGKLDVPIIDLGASFREKGLLTGHFKFDGHWDSNGHRWAAEAIFDYLVRNQEMIRRPEQ